MRRALPRRRRARRAGFTLLELMVALTVGALVVAVVFTLGGAASRHFQEQQRVGSTQQAVRNAMDRLRRDVERAGYGSVSAVGAPGALGCPGTPTPRPVPAIAFVDDDGVGNAALDTVQRGRNGVSADRLTMIGNYTTSDHYLARGFNEAGNVVFLQTDWLAFRRSFFAIDGTGNTVLDAARFNATFAAGRMLHIETRSHLHLYVTIIDSTIDGTGTNAWIRIAPPLGTANPCLEGFGEGSKISPINEVSYSIQQAAAGSALIPRDPAITGPNTQLVREELDMVGGAPIAGTRRAVLDFAVDFNVDFIIDTNLAPGNPPVIVRQLGPAAEATVANTPWQVRGVVLSLAARSPEQDARFPWPNAWAAGRPANAPLNRFQVFPARDGAARVRTMITEVHLPNLLPR